MISENAQNAMPLVSIIVPVYNTDTELLSSCFKSLINQNYSNIEIIIVDDGSNIKTKRFCNSLARLDCRIRVMHQKNQGVSAARNNGTLAAKGEYIFYVDGDDLLATYAIQEGMDMICSHDVDLVIAGIIKVSSHKEFNLTKTGKKLECDIIEQSQFDILRKHFIALDDSKLLKLNRRGYISRGPCCRLIRRSIAIANPFPKGLAIGEDLIWNLDLLNSCERICIVYNPWYGYLKQNSSAIRKYYGNRKEQAEKYLILLWNKNKDYCKKNLAVYGKNVAVELYCWLDYELLSSECAFSSKQKNKLVKKVLATKPWRILEYKTVRKKLPLKYKTILLLCNLGLWQLALKLKNKVK